MTSLKYFKIKEAVIEAVIEAQIDPPDMPIVNFGCANIAQHGKV